MIPLSLGNASEVYGDAALCVIERHWTDHPALADFSRSLRAFLKSLSEEATDDFWRGVLGPIRRLAFTFCSAPLPFRLAAEIVNVDWSKIDLQVRRCEHLFPDSHAALASIVQQLKQLSAEPGSPLIEPIEKLLRLNGGLSVVIRNPRMNRAVAAYFATNAAFRNAKVISATQLRGGHVCDVLVVIGPCGWHPEYVFSAPRAPSIHVISFRWIRDAWKPEPVLLNNSATSGAGHTSHRIGAVPKIGGDSARPDSIADIAPPDLLPPMPVFFRNGDTGSVSQHDSNEETIPARLCHLSGGRAVFVAADEGSSSLIIDTSELGRAAVRRSPVDELEAGQYLLLRTFGSGDFIAPLADRVLGTSAVIRRAQQTEWKERLLSRAIQQFGAIGRRELASRLCSTLRERGLSQAHRNSVHYWMSSKCIRPQKEEDFVAIMTFAELEGREREFWTAMGEIRRAHIRAGHLIRKMLLQKIAVTSLEPLERDGEMVFDLGDRDGGTLSAFQIVGMQGEEFEIPIDRIGVLIDGEE